MNSAPSTISNHDDTLDARKIYVRSQSRSDSRSPRPSKPALFLPVLPDIPEEKRALTQSMLVSHGLSSGRPSTRRQRRVCQKRDDICRMITDCRWGGFTMAADVSTPPEQPKTQCRLQRESSALASETASDILEHFGAPTMPVRKSSRECFTTNAVKPERRKSLDEDEETLRQVSIWKNTAMPERKASLEELLEEDMLLHHQYRGCDTRPNRVRKAGPRTSPIQSTAEVPNLRST